MVAHFSRQCTVWRPSAEDSHDEGGCMKIVFTDEEREGKVIGGVDTHTDTHWLCVLGERGDVRLS